MSAWDEGPDDGMTLDEYYNEGPADWLCPECRREDCDGLRCVPDDELERLGVVE